MAIPPVTTAPMIAHVFATLDIALLKEKVAIKITSIGLEFLNSLTQKNKGSICP